MYAETPVQRIGPDAGAGAQTMSNKEQHRQKEAKKKPALSPKEKKAAKRAKKQGKGSG